MFLFYIFSYLFICARILFAIEGLDDFCYKTKPYSIISLIFSSGFLVCDFFFSVWGGCVVFREVFKKIKHKNIMITLNRDQILFVREFFIQGKSSIWIKSSDNDLFVDDLKEKGVVTVTGASSQIPGRSSLFRYELDFLCKEFY